MEVNRFRIPLIILALAAAVFGIATFRSSSAEQLLASGAFHSVSHRGKGDAEIVQRGGARILRITDFRTYNRPGLTVVLIEPNDAFENEAVKSAMKYVVGPLTADEGDMEYEIPSDLDLGRFNAVTVWSERYEVNFTTAPLRWR